MIAVVFGVLLIFYSITQVSVVEEQPAGTVHYYHPTPTGPIYEDGVSVLPKSQTQFNNVVRQAYDYSCGSAALTTVLNYYVGHQFQERQIMDALLRFGEYKKIIERRGFSLLDMKRVATALGHRSGGFKAEMDDLIQLEQPAIVPIDYAGFKHFVVVKGYKDGRLFVADPSVGNISFTVHRFKEVWDRNVLFIVFPSTYSPPSRLEIAEDDLRYIDDRTINWLALKEMPLFSNHLDAEASRLGSRFRYEIPDGDDPDGSPIEVQSSSDIRFKSK